MAVAGPQEGMEDADFEWPDHSRRHSRKDIDKEEHETLENGPGSGQVRKRHREEDEAQFEGVPGPNMPLTKRPNLKSFPSEERSSNRKTPSGNDYKMEEKSDEEDLEDAMIEHIRWEKIDEEDNPYYIDRIFRGIKPRKWEKDEDEEVEDTTCHLIPAYIKYRLIY